MSYKTILVHFEDEERAHGLLEVACKLARDAEAHLVGLYPFAPVYMPAIMDEAYGAELSAYQRRHWEEEAGRLKKLFEDVIANQPFVGEWSTTQAYSKRLSTIVAQQCRTADLAVVSQSPQLPVNSASDVPEEVALNSGRPVLVVPRKGEFSQFGRRVLVAWNGRKESARAVFDALPLLQKADHVRVLTMTPNEGDQGTDFPGAEIAASLARHGVKAEMAKRSGTDGGTGEALLEEVADHNCDLLVMGCYGHSRVREFVFGGVTKFVLEHMTQPVLLSH